MEYCKIEILKESEIKEIEEIIKKILEFKKGGSALIDESLLERIINDVIKEHESSDYKTLYMAVKPNSIHEEDIDVVDSTFYKDNFLIEDFALDLDGDKVIKRKLRKNRRK